MRRKAIVVVLAAFSPWLLAGCDANGDSAALEDEVTTLREDVDTLNNEFATFREEWGTFYEDWGTFRGEGGGEAAD